MSNTLSLAELIKEKAKYKLDSAPIKKKLKIERLGKEIEITVTKSLCQETIALTNDEKENVDADAHFVYAAVTEPNLADKELQAAFECEDRTDIVHKIFEVGEIASIVEIGFELAGYKKNTVKLVEDVKN